MVAPTFPLGDGSATAAIAGEVGATLGSRASPAVAAYTSGMDEEAAPEARCSCNRLLDREVLEVLERFGRL